MSTPRLVVFDWGGVVLRICRTWEEGCERAGLNVHENDLTESSRRERSRWAAQYQLGAIDCDTFCRGIAGMTDGRMSPEDVGRLHDAWLIEEYHGMADLIGRLNMAEGVTTGLLSNTNAGHWARHLPQDDGTPGDYPAVHALEHRIGSHILGMVKPDPAIYRSMERLARVPPERIVFFDDLPENVAAARACGWQSERVDHTGDTADQIESHLRGLGVLR